MSSKPPTTDQSTRSDLINRLMPSLGSAASLSVIFIVALSIPLEAAETLGLTAGQTTGWIMAVYGVAGAASLALSYFYRQPLLLTGNIFILILISRLGTDYAWSEIIGATMVAGAVVLLLGPLGLTDLLSKWLPAPIVFGLLAGAVFPFLVEMFGALGNAPLLVGGTVVVFLVSRKLLEPAIPAILPALVAAFTLAALTGAFDGQSPDLTLPAPVFTAPAFAPSAIASLSPVMVVLITVQANAPSIVFLREQEYRPPERTVSSVSGVGTIAGSLFGPTGLSLSLPATALVAGEDAGPHRSRHWSVYFAGGFSLVVGILAGAAVELASVAPKTLLLTGVGLAVLGILLTALQRTSEGPLLWGPLFAFIIAASEVNLFGLREFFWAIVAGVSVSLLLEWEQWKELRPDN